MKPAVNDLRERILVHWGLLVVLGFLPLVWAGFGGHSLGHVVAMALLVGVLVMKGRERLASTVHHQSSKAVPAGAWASFEMGLLLLTTAYVVISATGGRLALTPLYSR